MKDAFTIYFAGSLFNHKDLTGNALLAQYIESGSENRYRCYLPQDIEQHHTSAREIRNELITKLIECDLGLFSFDGTELDAGVVVEFMLAKFLDIPAVILRSDFRTCGEKEIGGDDWNFMCSFYPRTQVVQLNAILSYQQALADSKTKSEAIGKYHTRIAHRVIESLESVRKEAPLLKGDLSKMEQLYQWSLRITGIETDKLKTDNSFLNRILSAKTRKRIA